MRTIVSILSLALLKFNERENEMEKATEKKNVACKNMVNVEKRSQFSAQYYTKSSFISYCLLYFQ